MQIEVKQSENEIDQQENNAAEGSTLHVGNLTRNVKNEHLMEIFSTYGSVKKVDLQVDKRVGLSKGNAYIEYELSKDAEQAMLYLDGGQLDGNYLKVSFILVASKRRRLSPEREKDISSQRGKRSLSPKPQTTGRNQTSRQATSPPRKGGNIGGGGGGRNDASSQRPSGRYGPADRRSPPRDRDRDSRYKQPVGADRKTQAPLTAGNRRSSPSPPPRQRPSPTRQRPSPPRRSSPPRQRPSSPRRRDDGPPPRRRSPPINRRPLGRRSRSRSRSPRRGRVERSRYPSPSPKRGRRSPSSSRSSDSSRSRSRSYSSGSSSRTTSTSSSSSSRSKSSHRPSSADKDKKTEKEKEGGAGDYKDKEKDRKKLTRSVSRS